MGQPTNCSIFLDNPQGSRVQSSRVRINLKEPCQCNKLQYHMWSQLLQYFIVIPHRATDHKGHFLLARFGFHIWLSIALVSEANKKQRNLSTWDFIHDLHWDFVLGGCHNIHSRRIHKIFYLSSLISLANLGSFLLTYVLGGWVTLSGGYTHGNGKNNT